MRAVRMLIVSLLILGVVLFIWGLHSAIEYSRMGNPAGMPSFLLQAVTIIGGVLATNLGAVFGIKIEQQVKRKKLSARDLLFFGANDDGPTRFQILAAYLYVAALVYAAFAWARLEFTEDPDVVVAILPQLSQTLLGVIAGLFAVAASRQNQSEQLLPGQSR